MRKIEIDIIRRSSSKDRARTHAHATEGERGREEVREGGTDGWMEGERACVRACCSPASFDRASSSACPFQTEKVK